MTDRPSFETIEVDVAVVGSGAAGLMALLHAWRIDPALRIAVVSKGAMGRSGCSLMVQGYNAVLDPEDSLELHLSDVLRVGEFLNDQELAWTMVTGAPGIIDELERQVGCYFDRRPDGSIDQRPFAGQSFPRKVHRGTETGLEVMGRLRDRVLAIDHQTFEDVRAIDVILDADGGVAGLTLLDVRRGIPIVLACRSVVVATGGAMTAYRVASAAREKSGDGMAMCYRAGLELRDMEMVQFLSIGMVAGPSRLTGILLEETLRYTGGVLLNGAGERFMTRYDPARLERAPRDEAVRAVYQEIMAGRGTPDRAVLLDMSAVEPADVERMYPALVEHTRMVGGDLARRPVAIAPAAHFQIGGVVIGADGDTSIPGLLVAGEDAGGVHGAGWTGGNGIAESTVFGARAGERAAREARERNLSAPDLALVDRQLERAFRPLMADDGSSPFTITAELRDVMWDRVGPIRDGSGLIEAQRRLDELAEAAERMAVPGPREANYAWQEALDVVNLITVARTMVASAAARMESRGVHHRIDHPNRDDAWLVSVVTRDGGNQPATSLRPVQLTRATPEAFGP